MFNHILIGIIAYILIIILQYQVGKFKEQTNELNLLRPSALSKIYFLNILFIITVGWYSYYVWTHQEGWSMYTVLGINILVWLFSYVGASSAESAEENAE